MPARSTTRRGLVRAGALTASAFAAVTLWAPAAAAAPVSTLPLEPPTAEVHLRPQETIGKLPVAAPPSTAPDTVTPMHHQWGATSRLLLPTDVDASAMVVELELSPSMGAVPTRTYSTRPATPPADQLVVNDLGAGPFTGVTQYEVVMPAYDAANPTNGRLVFAGLDTTAGAGVTMIDPLAYHLQFAGSGGIIQYHVPQVVVSAQERCPVGSATRCTPPVPVTAGSALTLTVPATSRLAALGFGTFGVTTFSLEGLDGSGAHNGELAQFGATSVAADRSAVTLTIPAETPAGTYRLTVANGLDTTIYGTDTLSRVAFDRVELQVSAAANRGLKSNTGWGESTEDGGTSGLVPLGAGMVLLAGLTTVVVLRRRQDTTAV
ncbi:hypothetical protein DQ244_05245 [Blastococcus sp. TBT05-19]|uniref:hypothetical protein n=1 Tax=Blastococcus sp. TBT05-19 TaxID=2250581 RepID=UPI000DE812A1|nr:hypothetical protein [Blastococcus sp. TBT05-19]RBY94684.1 hypothetical protein DQ244_05245 [Blastococcus sp. TBT05-19]